MIEYDQPMLAATAPRVNQDFDIVHETEHNTSWRQVKIPSLDDYDLSSIDGEETEIRLHLERWGDLQVPERLLSQR